MDELAQKTLDQIVRILRKKALDGYEVYLDQSSHFRVDSKEGKVDTFEASRSWGVAVRLLKNGRIGFFYSTSPVSISSKTWEGIVEEGIAGAEITLPDSCYGFAPALQSPPGAPVLVDETLKEISEARKIERARLLEETTRSADPRITKVRKASYQDVLSDTTLVNSNGMRFSYPSTFVSVSVAAVAEEPGSSEMGWDFDYSRFFNKVDVDRVARTAAGMAVERLGGKRIGSGLYPVLLYNHVASEFLSLVARSFLFEQVEKGKSPLKGKRGQKIFSPLLSFIDDGLHPEGVSTAPIDGEGTPSQKNLLVDRGEVCDYLYDRYWANRAAASVPGSVITSTGNSRRSSIKAPPGLGVSNFFISPGDAPFEKLLRDLPEGLLVEDVMGVHTVDSISGDFSLGCSGTWISGGEKAHAVKSVAIAGNLFDLFRKVIRVGNDLRFFGSVGSPTLLVEGVEVSGD
jgi:PmbA protein